MLESEELIKGGALVARQDEAGAELSAWEVNRDAGGDRIVVRFRSRISADDGAAAARRFVTLLGADTVDVTFEVRGVNGYESAARDAWQRQVWPLRHQVRSMRFVGTSALTRMGATLFGLALGVPTSFSED
jgi:hypothetical protein